MRWSISQPRRSFHPHLNLPPSRGKKFMIVLLFKTSAFYHHSYKHGLPLPLLHYLFHELANRLLVHPLGAIDERIAVRVRLPPTVSPRHFFFRDIDP